MSDPFKLSKAGTAFLFIIAAVFTYAVMSPGRGQKPIYRYNFSESLPGFLFKVDYDDKNYRIDDLIVFRMRHPDGSKIADATKIVKGLPGDVITVKGQDIFINGEFAATAKTHSKGGIELIITPEYIVPERHLFVLTPHIDSYDSRYAVFGAVPYYDIKGKAYRVF